jgi:ATP-dependent DNA helicase RecG
MSELRESLCPLSISAVGRIGLSDQAGTGIRAIFRNWHELGRVPPQIRNDKASKEFELVLVNKPLLTAAMQRFRQTLGADLAPDQAEALALGLGKSAGESLSLTDIRGLGLSTIQQAKTLADRLVARNLLEPLSEERFQVPEQIRQRFELETAQVTEQVGPKSGPSRALVPTDRRAAGATDQDARGARHHRTDGVGQARQPDKVP